MQRWTGGCLCGGVRYEAEGRPTGQVFCACRSCQRGTGTGHSALLLIKREQVRFSGEVRRFVRIGGSGLPVARCFCPTCGTTVYGEPEAAPRLYTIGAGTLDDPSGFEPALVLHGRERQAWDRASPPEVETTPAR
jgi:hypothetical protein